MASGNNHAFEHDEILGVGVERARSKLEYTNLALSFVAEEFTMPELQRGVRGGVGH